MGRSWMIASGKGGVGKSTLTASLAIALSRQNLNVVVVDADIGLRGVDLMLDMQDYVVYDLMDYLSGACTLQQALTRHTRQGSLYLLSAPRDAKASEVSTKDMTRVITALKRQYDIVLVDCPAGIGRGFKNIAGITDDCILVTTPDDASIRDAERAIEILREREAGKPYLVVNRADKLLVRSGKMMKPETIAGTLDLQLIGILPYDETIYHALLRHCSAMDSKNRDTTLALEHIALRIQGTQVPMEKYCTRGEWFTRRFRRKE